MFTAIFTLVKSKYNQNVYFPQVVLENSLVCYFIDHNISSTTLFLVIFNYISSS